MSAATGPVPDDVRAAVVLAMLDCESTSVDEVADAVLSVPAVAEVFARDAAVREIVTANGDEEAYDAFIGDVQSAARVRSLAARLDGFDNPDDTFFSATQLAALLRGDQP